jgi:hypothetical protein
MIFAIDFDGTIIEDKFPAMGDQRPLACDTIRRLQSDGHKFILWTCRCGPQLVEALMWLTDNGILPDAVNCNVIATPGWGIPKIYADVYLDDRSFPAFTGWEAVREKYLKIKSTVPCSCPCCASKCPECDGAKVVNFCFGEYEDCTTCNGTGKKQEPQEDKNESGRDNSKGDAEFNAEQGISGEGFGLGTQAHGGDGDGVGFAFNPQIQAPVPEAPDRQQV